MEIKFIEDEIGIDLSDFRIVSFGTSWHLNEEKKPDFVTLNRSNEILIIYFYGICSILYYYFISELKNEHVTLSKNIPTEDLNLTSHTTFIFCDHHEKKILEIVAEKMSCKFLLENQV